MLFALAGGGIQLVPDGTILFHLALILVMVALLNATLLKPINKILEERDRRTQGRLSEAESIAQTVDQRISEYESRLRLARTEAYALMEKERLAAAADRERRITEVRSEVSERVADEKSRLQTDVETVRTKLAADAQVMAEKIGERILERPVAS